MESVCGDGAPHAGTIVEERVRELFRLFAGTTRRLSDRPLDPFGVPSVVACPNNKQRRILHTNNPPSPSGLGVMGQGSKTLAGVSGAGPPTGVQGRSPCQGVGQSPTKGIPKGKALWCGAASPAHTPFPARPFSNSGGRGAVKVMRSQVEGWVKVSDQAWSISRGTLAPRGLP